MIVGLGTLSQLRALCLPSGFGASDDSFDPTLTAIGKGVAAQFDNLCNRKLSRRAGKVETLTGGNGFLSLSRYPVETLTTLATRRGASGDWTAFDLGGVVVNRRAGLITGVGVSLLDGDTEIQATYTGGFFIPDDVPDPLPPVGSPNPAVPPAGAVVLPADVNLAWQMQSAHIFEAANYFGTAAIRKPGQFDKMPPLTQVELLPVVRATLARFVRMA